ncbi:MAG: antibiotic biosynthesis monooxygenase [Candidatus Thiodiazotropha endolucinida]|uniref:Antibiotic biosynthesis monooxygenase n=2 Tax=Candidatus Thiodiazotropha TaxID=1913444 RepID=A0A7Z1AEB9_9GAMM|nr:antibiotic biosynthesis monooxygenase [Candidatus Thiodiazotropha endolucinida]MBT3015929.1 antibiotic biosynthesis monooxygenase [Candidatus Thiodiazotropha taylori]MBT3041975.1 antibiotic biosynthesis monooxygenase [Candidatus Thiodiazotropha sp. (ex Codakia orbicularis)]MBV2124680.1 antibiotic biosynthesis monooxygenase [Candidatus Thiodiazotropha taylori]MCG7864320.1 antibiotic biosynthesis monooxygenase [Candidatus Thiodiazotropha endolucinida]MCG7979562.1 antibiotic biosynthesis monoo
MLAVIFEVYPTDIGKDEYLSIAADLRKFLEDRDGFISIERFKSLVDEKKILSLSFWRDETAVEAWRNLMEHRAAQRKGKERLFNSYRIRVAEVVRDYSDTDREQAPSDSKIKLD